MVHTSTQVAVMRQRHLANHASVARYRAAMGTSAEARVNDATAGRTAGGGHSTVAAIGGHGAARGPALRPTRKAPRPPTTHDSSSHATRHGREVAGQKFPHPEVRPNMGVHAKYF